MVDEKKIGEKQLDSDLGNMVVVMRSSNNRSSWMAMIIYLMHMEVAACVYIYIDEANIDIIHGHMMPLNQTVFWPPILINLMAQTIGRSNFYKKQSPKIVSMVLCDMWL